MPGTDNTNVVSPMEVSVEAPATPRVGEPFNPYRRFKDSIHIPGALLRYPLVSDGSKLCFGRLLRFAGKNGTCWPCQQTLAKELGVSVATAKRYVAELKREGFIAVERRGRFAGNHYRFLWHTCFDSAATEPDVSTAIPPDSSELIPDSGSDLSPRSESVEASHEKRASSTHSRGVRACESLPNGFEQFIELYPKKVEIEAAHRQYRKMIRTPDEHRALMDGLERYLVSQDWQRRLADPQAGIRYLPSAARFIRDRLYLDEPTPELFIRFPVKTRDS